MTQFVENTIAKVLWKDLLPNNGFYNFLLARLRLSPPVIPCLRMFRLGVFDHGPSPKQKPSNNKVVEEASGKTQLPQQLTNYRTDQKEATPEEIERVYKIIKGFYEDDRKWCYIFFKKMLIPMYRFAITCYFLQSFCKQAFR